MKTPIDLGRASRWVVIALAMASLISAAPVGRWPQGWLNWPSDNSPETDTPEDVIPPEFRYPTNTPTTTSTSTATSTRTTTPSPTATLTPTPLTPVAGSTWTGGEIGAGGHWTGTITYAFNDSGSIAWTQAQKDLIRAVVRQYTVLGIPIVEVPPDASPNLPLTWSDLGNGKETIEGKVKEVFGTPTAILFNSNNGFGWFIDPNPTIDKQIPGALIDLFSVATHEFGHALGLGHLDLPNDVMYPVASHHRMRLGHVDWILLANLYNITIPAPAGAPAFTPTNTPSPSPTPSNTVTATWTGTPSPVPTPANTSANVKVRVTVVAHLANCRFGPNAAFGYVFGLRAGDLMDAVGRDSTGNWLLIQPISGRENQAWISVKDQNGNPEVQLTGDVMSLPDESANLHLPTSPLVKPTGGSVTKGTGNTIVAKWAPVAIVNNTEQTKNNTALYIFQYSTSENNKTVYHTQAVNDTSFTIPPTTSGFAPILSATVIVQETISDGETAYSETSLDMSSLGP